MLAPDSDVDGVACCCRVGELLNPFEPLEPFDSDDGVDTTGAGSGSSATESDEFDTKVVADPLRRRVGNSYSLEMASASSWRLLSSSSGSSSGLSTVDEPRSSGSSESSSGSVDEGVARLESVCGSCFLLEPENLRFHLETSDVKSMELVRLRNRSMVGLDL
ncbi:hypothetical protein OGAPHI_003682 [Ogataea philodendri]|uniref:Uncharacterized protein n=1 Tax=Ogataea philodendri TaxID=1378263 RepID=A0A9P8T531_9ASCO|nr:uncharacterized protein OGAPHI_003682 [Ogataea philodendri]KAH3665496.1 hypothetical protein OGAPHI_003682 [Ogataea philodendri]